jgi:two-component system, sensor histidine kinase and response regulator
VPVATTDPKEWSAGVGTPGPAPVTRVFVIDDDEVMLLSCRRILGKAGYEVETFDRGAKGLARLEQVRPQLLLVDLKMPELDGMQVIARVRQIDPDIVIAVLTGYATISNAVEALKTGAYDFLPKPFTPDELRLLVNRCCERWTLAAESARLRREKEEAERRFVTFVSHQLKSPVVAAKQYLDVLLFTSRDDLSPQTQDWLVRAQARLGEMIAVIDDWLTLSRGERGALCDMGATTDLGDVAASVVESSLAAAAEASVTIRSNLAGSVRVRGNPVSAGTVISNLVSNAIKYNRPGGLVDVRVSCQQQTAVLEVSDTGIGMSEECLPRLFREFSRIKNAATEDIPGTGLGLAICKRIVTELGGTIEVASRPGEGTRFTVRLPLAPEGEAASAPPPASGDTP